MDSTIAALLAHPRVLAARRHLEASDARTLARQRAVCGIPSPTGEEARRASHVAGAMREIGLADVSVDAVGNVRARHARDGNGSGSAAAPVLLCAHLDTVFGPAVDVTVRGDRERIAAPGISDNARGLAAMLAVAEAMGAAAITTRRPVWFVASVGEEGAGDLRGVRHLFDGHAGAAAHPPVARAAAFIALDGAGMTRIAHRAVGSRRYRATYRGPGGHSWAAYGIANPASAVGRAVAAIAERPALKAPRTTAAVVGLGGGTGLNTIPPEAWLELDLRSEASDALEQLDGEARTALLAAARAENARRATGTARLALDVRILGNRPSGETPLGHALVRGAVAATRALGADPELTAASTDANIPIALGVPAIAIGAGGRAGDTHLPTEWYENENGALGVFRALLVTLTMAEVV